MSWSQGANRLRLVLIAATTALVLAAVPAHANAANIASVSLSGDGKTVSYVPLNDNAVNVYISGYGIGYHISLADGNAGMIADGDGPGGCTLSLNNTLASCPGGAVNIVAVLGSSKADSIVTIPWQSPARALYNGGAGNDAIYGPTQGTAANPDVLIGGPGNDTIAGVYPGLGSTDGVDAITGGANSDNLYGDRGDDRLFGDDPGALNGGNDRLNGGLGSDLEVGGTGDDTLGSIDAPKDFGVDTMTDDYPGYPGGGINVFVAWGDQSTDLIFCAYTGYDAVAGGGDNIVNVNSCGGVRNDYPQ